MPRLGFKEYSGGFFILLPTSYSQARHRKKKPENAKPDLAAIRNPAQSNFLEATVFA